MIHLKHLGTEHVWSESERNQKIENFKQQQHQPTKWKKKKKRLVKSQDIILHFTFLNKLTHTFIIFNSQTSNTRFTILTINIAIIYQLTDYTHESHFGPFHIVFFLLFCFLWTTSQKNYCTTHSMDIHPIPKNRCRCCCCLKMVTVNYHFD